MNRWMMDFPHDFTTRMQQWLGASYTLLANALQGDSPVSIRLNPAKQAMSVDGWERVTGYETRADTNVMTKELKGCEKVAWCETGYYLPERPSFTFDPLFHAGCYYVQEASSMFIEQVVKQYITTPVVCLDLCAAPGGKSTHLQSLLPAKSLLVSNDVIQSRASVLKENMIKWGAPYTMVTCNDPKDFGQLTHLFDMIVADLPCSGEGMFRKDRNSRNEWSLDNVKLCAARQRRILHDIWPSLKPGGLLVFSTCTFNVEENEENIRHLIENYNAEVLPITIDNRWRISPAINESFPMYRFYPHLTKGEGFCLALVRKPIKHTYNHESNKIPICVNPYRPHHPRSSQTTPCCNDWIKLADDSFQFDVSKNRIQAIPESLSGIYRLLSAHLRVLYGGVAVGEIKGNDIVPSPALALSTCFQSEAFPSIELSKEMCIRYLQNEALVLPESVPKGYVVVKYQHTPLGFVKNIGTRANNLYPQEWRIRTRLPLSSSNAKNL